MARVVLNPSAYGYASINAAPLVRKCANAISRQARSNAPGGPYSTGTLKKSITRRAGIFTHDLVTNSVGSDLVYAYSVHQGQPARTITAVHAPMLRFFWRRVGRNVAFHSVNHPGTQGQPYLTSAMRQVAPRFGFATITYNR